MDRAGFLKLLAALDNPTSASAAAKQIGFVMKREGLEWDKLLSSNAFLSFVPGAVRSSGVEHKEVCAHLLGRGGLRSAEADFLVSISARDTLTDRQAAWFRDICKRMGV
jgi:hypothetical protein